MDKKQAFIFFGNSGSGKGTQANMLEDKLRAIDTREVLQVGTGARFRELINREGYVAKRAAKVTSEGGLQPVFLSVWNWAGALIDELNDNTHLILDGSPRRRREPPILETAFDFLEYDDVHVIYLAVPEKEVRERMAERGRDDDQDEKITRRIAWFNEYVIPMLEYYKSSDRYKYHHIDGSKHIDEVFDEIIEKVGL
jgi:adenylate kinase